MTTQEIWERLNAITWAYECGQITAAEYDRAYDAVARLLPR